MHKTTVYLPDRLRQGVSRMARATGRSEADVIRQAIAELVAGERQRPRPRGALFVSGDPGLSEEVDKPLEGFGQR
jgi:hypothetical protein